MSAGTFNPFNSQLRHALQTAPELVPSSGFRDFLFSSHSLGPTFTRFPINDIRVGSQQTPGEPGPITAAGRAINVDAWYPEHHAQHLAALQGTDTITEIVAAAAYMHRLTPATGTNSFTPRALQMWRDDGLTAYLLGARPQQAVFELSSPGALKGSIQYTYEELSRFAAAIQSAGTSTDPQVRGLPRREIAEAADGDLYVKLTNATPSPGVYDAQLQVKVGAASAYTSAPTINVFAATWTKLRYYNGSNAADVGKSRSMPVLIYFADFTGAAIGDEWRIKATEDVWAQSLPTRHVINETECELLKDGDVFQFTGATITVTTPVFVPPNVGRRFKPGTKRSGRRTVQIQVSREQNDVSVIRLLESGEPVDLRLHGYTGIELVAGNAATEVRTSFIMPDCRAEGELPGVPAADRFEESVTLTAYPNADGTYPNDLTIETVVSQATL